MIGNMILPRTSGVQALSETMMNGKGESEFGVASGGKSSLKAYSRRTHF